LEELVNSAEEDEEIFESEQGWGLKRFGEIFRNVNVVTDFIVRHDPSMERSLKIVREIN
jgi:hypothetical protein